MTESTKPLIVDENLDEELSVDALLETLDYIRISPSRVVTNAGVVSNLVSAKEGLEKERDNILDAYRKKLAPILELENQLNISHQMLKHVLEEKETVIPNTNDSKPLKRSSSFGCLRDATNEARMFEQSSSSTRLWTLKRSKLPQVKKAPTTKPKPFSFVLREEEKRRQKQLQQLLLQAEQKEKKVFKK